MNALSALWRWIFIVAFLALVLLPKTSQARTIASHDNLESMVNALMSAGYLQFGREIQRRIQIQMPADCGFTFFAPTDAALSQVDPSLYNHTLLYHIITANVDYDILRQLDAGTRLQTLLQKKSVVISTDTSATVVVDDVPVGMPDLYNEGSCFTAHGIDRVLNPAYSGTFEPSLNPQAPKSFDQIPSSPPSPYSTVAPPPSSGSDLPPLLSPRPTPKVASSTPTIIDDHSVNISTIITEFEVGGDFILNVPVSSSNPLKDLARSGSHSQNSKVEGGRRQHRPSKGG